MSRRFITTLAAILAVAGTLSAQGWAPAGNRIKTKWAEEVSPTNAHPEYPRPQMLRPEWKSLNGLWDYAVTPKSEARPKTFDGKILVPFAIESSLSGVGKALTPDDALWYSTSFSVPSNWKGKRLILNFDAVDWKAEVFVNDIKVGSHTGGYTRFSLDVTPYVKNGSNSLVVRVEDASDNDFQPRGKQVKDPRGIWYTSVSGIWQSVWIEPVAPAHITDYNVVSSVADKAINVTVDAAGVQEGDVVKVFLLLTKGFGLRLCLFQCSTSAILVPVIHLMTCDTLIRPIFLSLDSNGSRSTHSVKPAVLHVGMLSLSRPKLDSSMSDDMLCVAHSSFSMQHSLSRYWQMSSRSLRVLPPPGSSAFDTMALHLAAVSSESPSFLRIAMRSSNRVSTSLSSEIRPAFLCMNE